MGILPIKSEFEPQGPHYEQPSCSDTQKREDRLTKSVCARMSSPNTGIQQFVVQDISRFGIRGKAKTTPPIGEIVCVKLLDGQIFYLEVRWVKGDIFGARSNSPIDLNKIIKD